MRSIRLALIVIAACSVPRAGLAARAPSAAATAPDTTVTTVIVVRHAEKNTAWVGDDPPLTEAGFRRAQALAHALADAHVEAIWVTRFRRNRDTAAPLAAQTGDSIEVVDQGDPAALAARAWDRERGHTVLVVGHSDTVPAIVASLTGGPRPELESGQFDLMFVISRRGTEPVRLLRLRFGEP